MTAVTFNQDPTLSDASIANRRLVAANIAVRLRIAFPRNSPGQAKLKLSRVSGVEFTIIWRVMRGEIDIEIGTLARIAEGLNCPLHELFDPNVWKPYES